jgi:aryl-alcohol dehydrogenase-like predicted oxidoreductase
MKREIGNTGVHVFPIGLGAMPLSIATRPDEDTAIRVLHAAWDAGVQLVDTANVYCLDDDELGHNERLIRKALAQRPSSDVFVATKGGLRRPGGEWVVDGQPDHLRRSCERSLADLGVESIFLYQLHAPDDNVPFAESIGALAGLQSEGKIRHIGISNVTREQVLEALDIVRIETVQNRANPFFKRDYLTTGILELCGQHRLSYLPYGTVGGQRHHADAAGDDVLAKIAEEHHATPYQVMLAWHLAQSPPQVIPIPGASRPESIKSSAAAVDVELNGWEFQRINQIQDL